MPVIRKALKGTTVLPDHIKRIVIIWICLFLVSCAASHPVKFPSDDKSAPPSSEAGVAGEDKALYPPEPEKPLQAPNPRDLVSRELMEQAVRSLENNKPDESISTLERAVNISPGRGENYYYLAEAWYMKGNYAQAEEYNSLAAIYLKDDSRWMNLIEEQKARIAGSMH